MMSGPGAEVGEHFVRAAEISSAVRGVQSAKGRRMEGRGRGGCGGKKMVEQGIVDLGGGGGIREGGEARCKSS